MAEAGNVAGEPKGKRLTGRQTKWIIGGVVVAVTVGYLVFVAARGAIAYYVTVAELRESGLSGRNVRVAGNIVEGSIVWDPRGMRLAFDLVDGSGQMPVVYSGPRPDMFRDGAELVVEGRLSAEGIFEAHTLLLKCPSKYEEAQ
jgi:cytochrome c-type biogenesis protein CcmE